MGQISLSSTIGVSMRQASRAELDEFYAVYADSAKRLAYLLTGDNELAEDITQDSFVKIAGRLGGLRNRDAPAAYLRKTEGGLFAQGLLHPAWRRGSETRSTPG